MNEELYKTALGEVRGMLHLVNPDYISFFEDERTNLGGPGIFGEPLPAIVVGVNKKLDQRGQVSSIIYELIRRVPGFENYDNRKGSEILEELAYRTHDEDERVRTDISKKLGLVESKILTEDEDIKFQVRSLAELTNSGGNL